MIDKIVQKLYQQTTTNYNYYYNDGSNKKEEMMNSQGKQQQVKNNSINHPHLTLASPHPKQTLHQTVPSKTEEEVNGLFQRCLYVVCKFSKNKNKK